jgi:hypothetical protein
VIGLIEFFEIVALHEAQAEDAGWYYRFDGQEPNGPFPSLPSAEQAARASFSIDGVAA